MRERRIGSSPILPTKGNEMSNRFFTPENPPKAGKAQLIWLWWTAHKGHPPEELHAVRPGKHQLERGYASWLLIDQDCYRIYRNNLDSMLANPPKPHYNPLWGGDPELNQ